MHTVLSGEALLEDPSLGISVVSVGPGIITLPTASVMASFVSRWTGSRLAVGTISGTVEVYTIREFPEPRLEWIESFPISKAVPVVSIDYMEHLSSWLVLSRALSTRHFVHRMRLTARTLNGQMDVYLSWLPTH